MRHKLISNWKVKAAILIVALLCLAVFIKMPNSQAQSDSPNTTPNKPTANKNGTITEFSNGVFSVEPTDFAISQPVREMPFYDADAKEKLANFKKEEKLRIKNREQEIKKEIAEKKALGIKITKEEIELNRQNAKRVKKVLPGAGAGFSDFQDSLVKKGEELLSVAPQAMPTPSLTFNGATSADNAAQGIGGLSPPDVNGDVGPNHYVSSVNLVFKVFNKDGTVAAGPLKTSDLFASLPASNPCRTENDGDPIVVYDQLADRWHISQFAVPSPTNYQCVALSVTGDPTGAYYVWSYAYPNSIFNDYPKVGVWTDAYHMTFNQFNNAGTAFLGAGILSQDRAKALAGDPTASVVYFNIANIDADAGGLLPPDIDGFMPPPTGEPAVMAEYRADEFGDPNDAIRFYKWSPNFSSPGSSTLNVLSDAVLAAFDARNPSGRGDMEQSGGANLDSLSDRLMFRFAYRNLGTVASPVNSYVGNFTVNVSGVNPTTAGTYQGGIRWFELRRSGDTFSVFDQGTHNLTSGNGTGLNNWMGSIAQDNTGNIALGYSQSGTAQNADIKIAGRTNNVANSGVLNEGEALFWDALGSQSSTGNRWGDYSTMSVDPIDDCTFWYTQEYYATTSATSWSTRVGKFRFPQCTNAPKATITGTITACATGLPINQASVDITGGFNRLTIVNGTYTMTVPPGTYTVNASKSPIYFTNNQLVTVANGGTATANICLTGSPSMTSGTVQIAEESCPISNNAPEPGEEIFIDLPLQNVGGAATANLVATLQSGGGVVNPGAPQSYGAMNPSDPAVTRRFNFAVDSTLACGATVTLTWVLTDGATNLGTVTRTLDTGVNNSTTYSYTGPAVTIPDNNATGVNVTLPVSGFTGNISDLNFRLDSLAGCSATAGDANASLTHTFLGDVSLKLTSPQGTAVNLITRRGSSGNNFCTVTLDDQNGYPAVSTIPTAGAVAGNYSPESPLSAFNGQNPNGNWVLNVSDNAGSDIGTINRFSLIVSSKTCSSGCAQGIEADIAGRPKGDGLVQADDVIQVRRFVSGALTPATSPDNEFQRSDVAPIATKGDGLLASDDIIQVRRYVTGVSALQIAGGPTVSSVAEVVGTNSNKDKSTIKDALAPALDRVLKIQSTSGTRGSNVTVNLLADVNGDEAAYVYSINYNPAVLTYVSTALGTVGGIRSCNTATPGLVRCTLDAFPNNLPGSADADIGEAPAGTNQVLMSVTFTVNAAAPFGASNVTLSNFNTSNDLPTLLAITGQNGTVTVNPVTAANVSVSGRVLATGNKGVPNAEVGLINSSGAIVTARTNAFGYYNFPSVTAGESYVMTAKSKRFRYGNRAVQVNESLSEINFTPIP